VGKRGTKKGKKGEIGGGSEGGGGGNGEGGGEVARG